MVVVLFKSRACLLSYWTGYLYLCKELQLRTEAFSAISLLDDMSLLEEPNGKYLQYLNHDISDPWLIL